MACRWRLGICLRIVAMASLVGLLLPARTVAAPQEQGVDTVGAAANSPGVLSGNVIKVPINIPINVCGDSLGDVCTVQPIADATSGLAYCTPATPTSHPRGVTTDCPVDVTAGPGNLAAISGTHVVTGSMAVTINLPAGLLPPGTVIRIFHWTTQGIESISCPPAVAGQPTVCVGRHVGNTLQGSPTLVLINGRLLTVGRVFGPGPRRRPLLPPPPPIILPPVPAPLIVPVMPSAGPPSLPGDLPLPSAPGLPDSAPSPAAVPAPAEPTPTP